MAHNLLLIRQKISIISWLWNSLSSWRIIVLRAVGYIDTGDGYCNKIHQNNGSGTNISVTGPQYQSKNSLFNRFIWHKFVFDKIELELSLNEIILVRSNFWNAIQSNQKTKINFATLRLFIKQRNGTKILIEIIPTSEETTQRSGETVFYPHSTWSNIVRSNEIKYCFLGSHVLSWNFTSK